MKKNLALCVVLGCWLLSCSRSTYVKQSADVQGQTFAIVPFDVVITKSQNSSKNTPQAQLNEQAKSEGYRYQSSTYNYMLGRQKDFVVAFQDPDETNTLLKRAKISYEKLGDYTKSELAKLLKVDGIMSGKLYRKERMSQELGKAIDVFASKAELGLGKMQTNEATLNLSLYSSPERSVVWTYQYDLSGTADYTPESVAAALMQDAARSFPYRKKKR